MTLHFLAGYVLGEQGRQSARLAAQGAPRVGATVDDVYAIEDRMDRLILTVAAMWSLLKEQGLSDEQLQARIRELDEADGSADGKFTPRATICRSCGAKVGAGLPACQFCGVELEDAVKPGPFEAV